MRYRTLTKNKEFSRIYARGKSYIHPNLCCMWPKTGWAIPASD